MRDEATEPVCGPECACSGPARAPIPVALGMSGAQEAASAPRLVARADVAADRGHLIEQAHIPAGVFQMGDSSGDRNRTDGEVPVHSVSLDAFQIDATSVTNADFARFVDATKYVTDAERFGYSAVFHLALAAPPADVMGPAVGTPWWRGVHGADWRHPGGRDSGIDEQLDHPVVHVSWDDAAAYCLWAGRRLPTEAEWERASRGGLDGARYPWGDEEVDAGGWRANIWQGIFPDVNTCEDGWRTTAPVRSFEPNGFGMWQTVGNVWEWCAEWFSPRYYAESPGEAPGGPPSGTVRVLRGGSYLCHISYCNRYRNSARSSNTPDSSMGNAGFRTVAASRLERTRPHSVRATAEGSRPCPVAPTSS